MKDQSCGQVSRPVGSSSVGLLGRRGFFGLAGGAVLLGAGASAGRATTLPRNLGFRVFRKGTDIGRHDLTFAPSTDGFTVDSEVDLVVKVAFITAFSYQQRGRDVWTGEHLVASDIVTDDDGKRTTLKAWVEGDALRVEGAAGEAEAPLGAMTDLSFWNEAIMAAPQLIDSQTGEVGPIHLNGRKSERITVRGQEIAAVSYAIASSRDRSGRIWYDGQGNWVKAALVTRGENLDYELA